MENSTATQQIILPSGTDGIPSGWTVVDDN